jgi:hypothetical protein
VFLFFLNQRRIKMSVKVFDKKNLPAIRSAMDKALATVAKEFGLKISTGSCSYTPNTATFKVSLLTFSDDGEVITKEASDFRRYAKMGAMELKIEDLGRKIVYGGNEYTITGLNPRAHRFPILAVASRDGKTYKLPLKSVTGR